MLQGQVCGNTSAPFYNMIKQYIKSHPQEPFDLDFMPECFLEELKTDWEENQVEALDCCLRALDLDKLLETLYEFIETHIKYSPSNEKEWKYVKLLGKCRILWGEREQPIHCSIEQLYSTK